MQSKKSKRKIVGITELYIKWGHNSFLFTLACIGWLIWRVGTKPSRLSYPCSQFALWQTILFFSTTSTPFFHVCSRLINYIRNREYDKVGRIVLLAAILTGSFTFYQNYQENQLRIRGSGTIPVSSSAVSPRVLTSEPETASPYFEFPSTISMDQAVVSFKHDPLIYYGGAPPYDPAGNPVYDFVRDAVLQLQLGSPSNPLDGLIDYGDTVLIKPNWVDFGPAVYTRPEVVRPLIDMAIAAGATEINVGDGGTGIATTDTVMNSANYTAMVSALDSLHPGINIQTVNLNAVNDGWHWISLSSNSSFAGSGYSHADLGTGDGSLFEHNYYMASDNQSVSPGGNTLGWYAVSDKILDADVIINVPKIKTHQEMMATISIKNFVGCTLSSTFDETNYLERIAHHHQPKESNYFTNDIFWRAILDMNKIILYADKEGVLQPTQQRMYLSVVDGIQAMERSQHHSYGGGGIPYNSHVILAGIDPVSVDAVGCRIMGYDYNIIPSIGNADSDPVHPIGISSPQDIVIVGDDIDSEIAHVFTYNDNWDQDADDLDITDFTPPTINSVFRDDNTVTANISGGLAAYLLYQVDGAEYIEIMSRDGNTYTVTTAEAFTAYKVRAQDEHFNTAQAAPPSMETIVEAEGHYYNAAPVFSNFGFDDDTGLDDGWYQMDPFNGTWEALFSDAPGVSWDDDGWTIPGFGALSEGNHTIYFMATDDEGYFEGESGEWNWQFFKDTIPPEGPTGVGSTSHTASVWSGDNTVNITWTGAIDSVSGVDGYSILWDTSASTIPDQIIDIGEVTDVTSPPLADGNNHYFHISSVDNAGNWQTPVHLGPFYIAATSPVLSGGTVSPADGDTLANFTYSVNYTDFEDEAPNPITVSIDSGTPVNMTAMAGQDGDFTNGEIYEYIATGENIGVGIHTFQFAASDGTDNAIGDTGPHTGPTVTGPGEIISLTVTDYGNDGIFFGSLVPGMNNQPADGQPGQATVTIIIGSETNVDVDVQLKATNFTGPSTIDVGNIKYDDDSDFSDALTMTVDYVTWYSVAASPGEDHVTSVYYWLSIPDMKPAGTYNSIFSYRAIRSP